MVEEFHSSELDDPKVAFNRAVEITRDITYLRRSYFSAYFSADLMGQFKALTMIKGIIKDKFKPEEATEVDEFEEQLFKDIKTAELTTTFKGRTVTLFGTLKDDVEKRLKEYSEVLYMLENKYGFGMTDQNDPRFALING